MHLMIDLETLSTAPTAVVTQLGWAVFDPDGDGVASSDCVYLDAQAQIDRGLTVDWSTIQWWLMQEQAAREKMASDNVVLPSVALDRFDQVFDVGIDGVWSHGATFDVVIMENLYKTAKRKVPWKYRDVRDTRTVFWLAGSGLVWAKNEVKHSAEHDAIAQALTLQRALKMINEPKSPVCPHPENLQEIGYGMAGSGMGIYTYCGVCEHILDKVQDEE